MRKKTKLWLTAGFQLSVGAAAVVACSDATEPPPTGSAGSVSSAGTTSAAGSSMTTGGAPNSTAGTAPTMAGTSASGGGSGGSLSTGGTGTGGAAVQAGAGGTTSGGTTSAGSGGASAGGKGGSGGVSAGGSGASGGSGGGSTGSCANGATAKPCPPTEPNSVAYIGCSMADNIGQGYGQVSGKIMWNNSGYGTGAKVVENWGPSGDAWSLFATKLNAIGGKDKVKALMVQICVLSTHSEDNVKAMIAAARTHVNPGTHIYLVGQPQYEAGHTCSLAGPGGAEWTDTTAKKMAADSSVNQDLTYLGQFKLDTTKNESSDGCHASATGLPVLGNQAKAFWGG
jgi:hypothetical protein